MDTKSTHLLIELWGCENLEVLDSCELMEKSLREVANVIGVNVLNSYFHKFHPQGVSGVLVISESHFSVHSWPDTGYAALDFFTCGDKVPSTGLPKLFEILKPKVAEVMDVNRGRIVENFRSTIRTQSL